MIAKQVYYEGRVQGVGFRWTVRRIATGFDVCGWVKNLPDGRVELQASGEADELAAFLAAIEESELAAHIKRSETRPVYPPPTFRGFEIAG